VRGVLKGLGPRLTAIARSLEGCQVGVVEQVDHRAIRRREPGWHGHVDLRGPGRNKARAREAGGPSVQHRHHAADDEELIRIGLRGGDHAPQ
jgi:hypothetical protein